MWPFKTWSSVTRWVENSFPKYKTENKIANIAAAKALFLRNESIAAITNRPYVTKTEIGDKQIDISTELEQLLAFARTQHIVAVDYPVISRKYRLRGRVFMVCLSDDKNLNLYGLSMSDKLGDKIDGIFTPSTINKLGIKGKKYCRTIDDTPYWRAAVKMNIYRLMMLKSGAKVESLTLIALGAAYDNFQLIEIPIIDSLNRVAYKL